VGTEALRCTVATVCPQPARHTKGPPSPNVATCGAIPVYARTGRASGTGQGAFFAGRRAAATRSGGAEKACLQAVGLRRRGGAEEGQRRGGGARATGWRTSPEAKPARHAFVHAGLHEHAWRGRGQADDMCAMTSQRSRCAIWRACGDVHPIVASACGFRRRGECVLLRHPAPRLRARPHLTCDVDPTSWPASERPELFTALQKMLDAPSPCSHHTLTLFTPTHFTTHKHHRSPKHPNHHVLQHQRSGRVRASCPSMPRLCQMLTRRQGHRRVHHQHGQGQRQLGRQQGHRQHRGGPAQGQPGAGQARQLCRRQARRCRRHCQARRQRGHRQVKGQLL
jgi:hypothetical protein